MTSDYLDRKFLKMLPRQFDVPPPPVEARPWTYYATHSWEVTSDKAREKRGVMMHPADILDHYRKAELARDVDAEAENDRLRKLFITYQDRMEKRKKEITTDKDELVRALRHEQLEAEKHKRELEFEQELKKHEEPEPKQEILITVKQRRRKKSNG